MSRGAKLALIIVGAALGGIGALVGLIFYASSGVVTAADHFLAQVGTGESHAAWLATGPEFKKDLDEAGFDKTVKELGLDGYASRSWSSRKIENSTGVVEGTVKTRAGEEIPLQLTLVKRDGAWQVAGLTSQRAVHVPPPKRAPPDDGELRRTVTATAVDFNAAVAAGSFAQFHAKVSKLWQAQIDPAGLKSAFASFAGVALPALSESKWVFDQPPIVDDEGLLHVTGYFVGAPRESFRLGYVFEDGWKLEALKVRTNGGAATRYVPDEAQLESLATESLLAFGKAVHDRDMKTFHAQLSLLWQEQITPDELARVFAPFLKKRVELSKRMANLSALAPVFDQPALTNDDGVLVVAGHFPTKPDALTFQLKYLYEHPRWRLLGINVSTLE